MEQELQMASCLFGGPPVRDDLIKLGESQIGFMNIFARPLFEAVTDILPAMRFAVDEILANKAVWEKKIDDERQRKRKNPKLSLGLLTPSFMADPTPSPLSGGPLKQQPAMQKSGLSHVNDGTKTKSPEEAGRRGSNGSIHAATSPSRRSSSGVDKGSRRSSAAGIPAQRGLLSRENQDSRRGSGDASLTAILVTQTPNAPDANSKDAATKPDDGTRGNRKDTLVRSSSKKREKDNARPVTAPSQARHSQGEQ